MASRVLSLALWASSAVAAPALDALSPRSVTALAARDDECPDADASGQPLIAKVGFYSEKDCNDRTDYVCIFTTQGIIDGGSGVAGCNPGNLPDTTPFYAKVDETGYDAVQLQWTRDQSCPPSGPGAVFATLTSNGDCVMFNKGGDEPGLAVYPKGGSPVAKKKFIRDDGTNCDGFDANSQQNSYSPSVQLSNIIDCTNGADAGCTITIGQQHTESTTTSATLTAGGGVGGFEVSATFGEEYTESDTTTTQEGFSIPKGQKGYLSAYSSATLFKGKFTGCDSGNSEQDGSVLAIKEGTFAYSTVITGARKALNGTEQE